MIGSQLLSDRGVRTVCIQNSDGTLYLDPSGEWTERANQALTFKDGLDAIGYIGARGLDGKVCFCECNDEANCNSNARRQNGRDAVRVQITA